MATQANPFSQLPDLLWNMLVRVETIDINIDIATQNKLTEAQGKGMMGVIRKIILKSITPRELLDTIRRDITGLNDQQAKKLALDLLGRRFLPMQWYIGNVEQLILELGGKVDEYLVVAKKIYPEVYAQNMTPTGLVSAVPPRMKTVTTAEVVVDAATLEKHPVLHNFDERVGSLKGRAEVLLRLTGLSSEVEEAMKAKKVTEAEGEQLLKTLDGLSYAVNTKDLNALEVEALRRGIKKVLRALAKVQ